MRWAKGAPRGGPPLAAAFVGDDRHMLRGGRHQGHWAMWPPVVGQRADEGGRRGPRGGRLLRRW